MAANICVGFLNFAAGQKNLTLVSLTDAFGRPARDPNISHIGYGARSSAPIPPL